MKPGILTALADFRKPLNSTYLPHAVRRSQTYVLWNICLRSEELLYTINHILAEIRIKARNTQFQKEKNSVSEVKLQYQLFCSQV